MLAASSKLFDGPLPLFNLNRMSSTLRLSHHHHHYLSTPLSVVPNLHYVPIKLSQQFKSRSSNTPENNNNIPADDVPPSHPWPEWSELLQFISVSGNLNPGRSIKDQLVPNESLSMEFVDAACSFLGFAGNRPDILGWLPKNDVQVLVNNGTPFLFKNAIETEKRIRSFLQGEESSEATTLDLMKYILSYASNPIFYPERNIKEATELAARNLLRKMTNFNGKEEDDQTPTNLEQNITIKRGDWICQKCNFKNVATNTKCLECEELRPQRQLTGNEWDCPKCSFFNHGRNATCLKCECKRPVAKIENQIKDTAEDEKSEKWFNKVAELHDVTDLTSVISDDDFPEIMPMRKGENRFVVSKKKDRSLNSPTYKQQQAIEQEKKTNFVPFVPFPPGYFAKKDDNQQSISTKSSQKLHENSIETANDSNHVQETRNTQMNGNENRPETLNGDRVNPGNPNLRNDPLDMSEEAKTSLSTSSPQMSHRNSIKAANDNNLVEETRNSQVDRSENGPETMNSDRVNPNSRNGFRGPSLEGSAVKETDPLDMSEEAKAERWFRRVAQIKDISELSQIPDEDFPSIMPMRKGVNRFVVSKRKTPLERRLSSPEYRKDLRTVRSEPSKKEDDDS
ncbi:zinc finger protein VAR3, chloroplastic-like isoform X2 [Bidens hawaiensis]|uniref:zinc finger protein VAR3, chloroplastic-like isoform X2 n=1 Tax=Bidens hawaiensis TaxID=980011 RepID=UPI00404A0083